MAIKARWLAAATLIFASALLQSSPSTSSSRLLREFETNKVFFEQFETGEQLVALHDPAIVNELLPWLSHQDRPLR